MRSALFAVCCWSALASWLPAEPATWTQWRGPNRDGTIVASEWPLKIDESTLKPKWQVELQPSYSGPIVTATGFSRLRLVTVRTSLLWPSIGRRERNSGKSAGREP